MPQADVYNAHEDGDDGASPSVDAIQPWIAYDHQKLTDAAATMHIVPNHITNVILAPPPALVVPAVPWHLLHDDLHDGVEAAELP